jgi:hypothetical protein
MEGKMVDMNSMDRGEWFSKESDPFELEHLSNGIWRVYHKISFLLYYEGLNEYMARKMFKTVCQQAEVIDSIQVWKSNIVTELVDQFGGVYSK